MSEKQHEGARKLLNLIQQGGTGSRKLTYRSAAEAIGISDFKKHSRTVAQMCDLLDAAACFAGVPLLALVAIRSNDGSVNPEAWKKEYGAARDAIIERSQRHHFSPPDFKAIEGALSYLKGLGN